MPAPVAKIKDDFERRRRTRNRTSLEEQGLEYADIAMATVAVLAVAWIADQLGGRRGFGGATLVAGVGAICGWFLPIRVFGLTTMDSWLWVIWSVAGAALSLLAYYLFRSKR